MSDGIDAFEPSASEEAVVSSSRRGLASYPSYLEATSTQLDTKMNIVSFFFLAIIALVMIGTFVSCFMHSLLTSPLFTSARRHRLPLLVPPPLPTQTFLGWAKACFYMSDEEIARRVGYDSLIFLRFHRLSLRCLVKISLFSLFVLLPINFTGGEHKRNEDDYGYVIVSDFSMFTMANVAAGSPRLWIHCFGAYLMTTILVSELLNEYEDYNVIRHRYLLAREPHLRTVLVQKIPPHMRSKRLIEAYFERVYPNAIRRTSICQNVVHLERLVAARTDLLARVERTTFKIAMQEKLGREPTTLKTFWRKLSTRCKGEDLNTLGRSYAALMQQLEEMNGLVSQELKRRKMIMHHMDKMDGVSGTREIDFLLAHSDPTTPRDDQDHENEVHGTEGLFVEPPLLRPSFSKPRDFLENHLIEVTDKAFVTFKTYTAATIAAQSMHGSKPSYFKVSQAPEPRAILWENIHVTTKAERARHILGNMFVLILIGCYAVPTTLISLLVSEAALVSFSPLVAKLVVSSGVFSSLVSFVQPICIVLLQQALPPLFLAMSKIEGQLSFCDVQIRAFSRYFAFQVVNVFLITAIAGSIFETAALIAENPGKVFQLLGYALPKTSSFFCYYIILKCSLGLGVELVRVVPILQAFIKTSPICHHDTIRDRRKVIAGIRPIDDPGWMPIHKVFAQDMLVVVIGVVFAVIAPLVLIPAILFCLFSRIVWTHQFLYIYESCCESGGLFWPKAFRRFVFGIILAQATVVGQFMLKGAWSQAYVTIILMIINYFYLKRARYKYDMSSSALPLEIAAVMDINVDNDKRDTANKFNEASYLQPALRAAPIAMPEIPFPPQQMDFKALKSSRRKNAKQANDAKLVDFLVMKEEKSKCVAELYTDADMQRVEAGWKNALSEESAKSSGLFNKVAVGLDGGTLIIPRVELTSKRRTKAVML